MDSPNSPNPYDNMSLKDIIIAECTDDHDDQYFKALIEGGSSTRQGRKRAYIDRGNIERHQRLFDDYFSDEPVYTEYQFRRRFRMCRHIFLHIVQALENHSKYFHMGFDAVGRRGFCHYVAMQMLAYGAPTDYVDEYVRIGETTAIECLVNFVRGVNYIFGTEYLRRPNAGDIRRLLQMGEVRSFPSMLGSIDCMHWELKIFPVAGKANSREVITADQQSCSKQLRDKIFGYDMHFLVFQDPIMISTC
ncbi:uncharacterized protein LOC133815650 [Humulus lupulus]|uniref:uncharacterized protein LOC133815650 n=1 Tax=Humulus lupulus TaxID=3486 RepID=UPI002B401240|nr:uncharacterized protein LOC133815650 [Humulus lupulus]